MPLQATSGAASYDGFGGGVAAVPNYIEDVFSTYLYTGNGSTQTITNGIDLAGKGGLVWVKNRNQAAAHVWVDTARGASNWMSSASATGQNTNVNTISSLNSNGFSVGNTLVVNNSGDNIASWTFRKQPKFFDVVTYTGDGTNSRYISHSLGSAPGCMMIKATSTTSSWYVYHRAVSLPTDSYLELNSTSASISAANMFNGTNDVRFRTNDYSGTNTNGVTYVCYLFAHDAGGFGLTGTDNVISCGSFTADGAGSATVSLGYEPQWVLIKNITSATNWIISDTMRGWLATGSGKLLFANLSNAESNGVVVNLNATGFYADSILTPSASYIYVAIRRGPMKVPTSGTSVYATDTLGGTSPNPPGFHSGFPVDLGFYRETTSAFDWNVNDRLRGNVRLFFNSTAAESSTTAGFDYQDGFNSSTSVLSSYRAWMFRRAPSFFDEVCYTGTGVARTVTHNLGVAPQLIIAKSRSGAFNWTVYSSTLGNSYPLFLNGNSDGTTNYGALMWGSTAPTSTQFPVGTYTGTNSNGQTYVAYLFATCAGVSKVGSYTGNGSTQTINCGFTGGARFVLIKRTDSTGDWYVWDTARGIISANDPHLSLNTTVAEVTTDDTIDPDSTGFIVNQVTATNVNVSSATYIYLAIA